MATTKAGAALGAAELREAVMELVDVTVAMVKHNQEVADLFASGKAEIHSVAALHEAQRIRCALAPMARISRLSGEAKACAIFDAMFVLGDISRELGSEVACCKPEVQVAGLRVDRVLYHEDGSVSAVEIKPVGSRRDMVHGVGQALLYAAALIESGEAEVRPVLFVSGERDSLVAEACRLGGVEYVTSESTKLWDFMGDLVGMDDGHE